MANDGSRLGWGLRHFRDGVGVAQFFVHLLACARDPERGLLAAHRAKTMANGDDPDEAFVDERRYRQAELSVAATVGGGRGPSRVDPTPVSGRPQARQDFDPTHDLVNLIANAEAAGIAVTWCEVDVRIGGSFYRPAGRVARRRDPRAGPRDVDPWALSRVTIGDLVVVLNPTQAWVDTFEVVLHELAHLLLGHAGPRPSVRQAPRLVATRERPSHDGREFEASSATLAVTLRRGGRAGAQVARVMHHVHGLRSADALRTVDLLEVFRVAELLAAWCRLRPPSVGVLAPRGPRPVGPAVGRAAPGDDREAAGSAVPVGPGRR